MTDNELEFFKFVYKRHLIWYKRFILKENPPWTDDIVLQTFKIINVYRELDRCTIYLLRKLKDIKDRRTLLLNIIFYRFFNLDNIYEDLGIDIFSDINEDIIVKFDNLKSQGRVIFNNAYIISSGGTGKKHVNVIKHLSSVDIDALINKIDGSKTPEESFDYIKEIPMVGPFLACEIWTDLTYFNFFKQNWDDNDFVNIGPGAKWGLELLYGKITNIELKKKLYHLYSIQNEILPQVHIMLNEKSPWNDIAYKTPYSNYPFLSITNIEGSLCEFRKYSNISRGKGRRKYFSQHNTIQKSLN